MSKRKKQPNLLRVETKPSKGKPERIDLDIKRLYLPGFVVRCECSCGKTLEHDLGSDYLSYVPANEDFEHTLYCEDCDTETVGALRLTLNVEAP
jgi:hypothetical protein